MRLVGEYFGTKSETIFEVLNKRLSSLHEPECIAVCVEHLLNRIRVGPPVERANTLPLLAAVRNHSVSTREIDRELTVKLKSRGRRLKVAAAKAIGVCGSWNCDEESYRILLSMANSRSRKVRLSALSAICATISSVRASSTLEVLRRGLSSDESRIRAAAARACARLGRAGVSLRDDLLNSISAWPAYKGSVYRSRFGTLGQIRSFVFFSRDYGVESDAQACIRRALVALTTTKGEYQQLIEQIAQRIADSKKPYFALVPLVQTIGSVAEKYCSLKSLESLLRVLRLLEEGFDGIDFGSELVFFGPSFVTTAGDEIPLQKEIMAVGKKLHGRDVTKCVKHALENQGELSKLALLRALPEFETNVRNELVPTMKEIANNDAPRVRKAAWDALQTINLARGTWHTVEPSTQNANSAPAE